MSPRFGTAALLLALVGCAHAERPRARATLRLITMNVTDSARGELALLATYRLDGLPLGDWKPERASLTVSIDDIPFGAVVVTPQLLAGDRLRIPVAMAFVHPPREVAPRWERGEPLRVRLRGWVYLASPEREQRIPSDVEAELVLPVEALPPSRG